MSRDIPLILIDPDPAQARRIFDVVELAASMAATGQAVPVLVRPVGDRFVLVHGERRLRAAQSLGWETIEAEVRDLTPEDARWLALVENVQRADLSPVEEAQAYQAVLATGVTQTELGRRLGKSQSYIATKLRFLALPDEVQRALDTGTINEGHAKQLLRLRDPEQQTELVHSVTTGHYSVQQLRLEVDRVLSPLAPDEAAELQRAEAIIERGMVQLRKDAPAKVVAGGDDAVLAYWHERFATCIANGAIQ
jgi:ParB family chromosome partitioning protein